MISRCIILVAILTVNSVVAQKPSQVYRPGSVKRKPAPYGTLNISTEIPATLVYDGKMIMKMTTSHQVTIQNTRAGNHSLIFRNNMIDHETKIRIDSGDLRYYTLQKDTTLSDSVGKGRTIRGKKQEVYIHYIPFRHAWNLQVFSSLYFNSSGIGFNEKVIAGYWLSKCKIGLGTGILQYPTHLKYRSATFGSAHLGDNGLPSTGNFHVTVIPLFVNFTAVLTKKRAATFLSFDLGATFPVTQSIQTGNIGYVYNHDIDAYEEVLQSSVDRISAGFYFGIALGVKYYINTMYDVAFSFGFDGSANNFSGSYLFYSNPGSSITFDGSHTSSAFYISVAFGLNMKRR